MPPSTNYDPGTVEAGQFSQGGTPYDQATPLSIDGLDEAIRSGLKSENERLRQNLLNSDYYYLRGWQHLPYKEAQADYDYGQAQKCTTGILRKAVRTMCRLYPPGPSRKLINDAQADKLLAEVLKQNHVNVVMREAERLSMVNDVSMVQVCATGNADKPIRLQVLGAEEFAVWCPDTEPTRPWAVCTIQRVGEFTRYQLFTEPRNGKPGEVRTYLSRKDETSKDAKIELDPSASGLNPYGCLPFVAVHHEPPLRGFWNGSGVGTHLRMTNTTVDVRLTRLDGLINWYTRPLLFARNVAPEWRPTTRDGAFQRLPRMAGAPPGVEPEIDVVQPQVEIANVWEHVRQLVDQVFQDIDLPISVARGGDASVQSGIALMVEQVPLQRYIEGRQPQFSEYEADLARVILLVLANYYRKPRAQAAAEGLDHECLWAEPKIPLPLPERDQTDQFEVDSGYMSQVQIVQRRLGMTREQALEHLQQVAEDREELVEIFGEAKPEPAIAPTAQQTDEDDAEDPGDNTDDGKADDGDSK